MRRWRLTRRVMSGLPSTLDQCPDLFDFILHGRHDLGRTRFQAFMPPENYINLLEILMLTVFGAYFAGRTIEKVRK